ncbi:MAG: flagellar biosynthesis anti-sigma factor FlgM [Armatimonadota bacterium]
MNIGKIAIDKIAQIAAPARSAVKGIESAPSALPDLLNVSHKAQEVSSLLSIIKDMPDVRQGVVEAASKKLEDGKLNVSSDNLAAALLEKLGGQG